MKRFFCIFFACTSLLLGGCASTITSDVTTFHAWPASLSDKSFVFAPEPQQEGSLEYRNYAQLIGGELLRLGFSDGQDLNQGQDGKIPALTVRFQFGMRTGTLVVTEPAYDPYMCGPGYMGGPGRPWRRDPFYDPFWPRPVQQTAFPVFHRQLHLTIEQTRTTEKLYDVTVDSAGYEGTLTMAMPYMVRSAFADFPGPSGVTRHIALDVK